MTQQWDIVIGAPTPRKMFNERISAVTAATKTGNQDSRHSLQLGVCLHASGLLTVLSEDFPTVSGNVKKQCEEIRRAQKHTHSYFWLHSNHQADKSELKAFAHNHAAKTWAFATCSHTNTVFWCLIHMAPGVLDLSIGSSSTAVLSPECTHWQKKHADVWQTACMTR